MTNVCFVPKADIQICTKTQRQAGLKFCCRNVLPDDLSWIYFGIFVSWIRFSLAMILF